MLQSPSPITTAPAIRSFQAAVVVCASQNADAKIQAPIVTFTPLIQVWR